MKNVKDKVLAEWSKPVNLKKMPAKERRFYFFCRDFAKRLGFKNLWRIGLKHLILDLSIYLDHESTGQTETMLRKSFESFEAKLKEENDRVFEALEKF